MVMNMTRDAKAEVLGLHNPLLEETATCTWVNLTNEIVKL